MYLYEGDGKSAILVRHLAGESGAEYRDAAREAPLPRPGRSAIACMSQKRRNRPSIAGACQSDRRARICCAHGSLFTNSAHTTLELHSRCLRFLLVIVLMVGRYTAAIFSSQP